MCRALGGKMEKQIFMSASYYKQKYYTNPEFEGLPVEIRNHMKDLCIMLAEKLHGIITLGFHLDGEVFLDIAAEEGDIEYDEIGAQLELKEVREEQEEKFKTMKLWYLMYQTDYGEIFRQVIKLHHNEKKTSDEIVDLLIKKHGENMRETIIQTMEIIQE